MTKLNEVIDLVNRARRVLGLSEIEQLPKGRKLDSCKCPLARSLPAYVDRALAHFRSESEARVVAEAWSTDWWVYHFGDYAVRLPEGLSKFTVDFDKGKLPNLIETE